MTGSSLNVGVVAILAGQPLAEDEIGNVLPASATNPAFAVATSSGKVGAYINWTTDDIVTRDDWFLVAGVRRLTPGTEYFVGGEGITTDGNQAVGVARSAITLRVRVGPVIPPITADDISSALSSLVPSLVSANAPGQQVFGPEDGAMENIIPTVSPAFYIAADGTISVWILGSGWVATGVQAAV